MQKKKLFTALCALSLTLTTVSCAKNSGFSLSSSTPPSNSGSGDNSQGTPPTPTPPPTYSAYPLLWEASRPEGKSWTDYLYTLIQQLTPNLIAGAEDMDTFCPAYASLANIERVNLWGLLISAMVKYESGFDPLSRMQETTMGTDPVTGRPVYSEGLLQLSYQDVRSYPFCDEFDWGADQHLGVSDPKKTILDPYKNLKCGVQILAQQIKDKSRITLSSGVYWAVIKINGTYSKISQIAALTKKMPGCMN